MLAPPINVVGFNSLVFDNIAPGPLQNRSGERQGCLILWLVHGRKTLKLPNCRNRTLASTQAVANTAAYSSQNRAPDAIQDSLI